MIHEITKGMPNASQVINENFQMLNPEVIENEFGRCVKYPDGTMRCEKVFNVDQTTSQNSGNIFRTPQAISAPFPESFIKEPYTNVSLPSARAAWGTVGATLTSWEGLRYYSPFDNQLIDKVILVAEGIWKE